MTRPDRQPVSTAEIAALTARLRALTAAGRDADAGERAVFLADKDALLDRITHPDNRDRHEGRGSGREDHTMTTHDSAAAGGSAGYRLRRPAEAMDELARALPGGSADAQAMVEGYLAAMSARHGEPAGGWRLDDDDLAEIAERYAWVDTAGGETLPEAQARAAAEGEALRDRARVAESDGLSWTARRIDAQAADWEQRARTGAAAGELPDWDAGAELSDDDGWVSGGFEAAHQAHLDYVAESGDRAADTTAGWWETEQGQTRIAAWAGETADPDRADPERAASGRVDRPEEIAVRIQDIRDQVHAQALAEAAQRARTGGEAADDAAAAGADDDGPGWSR